jgi:hypothetical protein
MRILIVEDEKKMAAVLMSTKKVPEPIVILAAGVVGVFLHGTVG